MSHLIPERFAVELERRYDAVFGRGAARRDLEDAPSTAASRIVAALARERDALRADRDRYVRLFNRLDAAISHHKAGERFPDDHDEALWAARDRILTDAAKEGER